MELEHNLRELTVKDDRYLGTGTTADVYRLDDDRIVKVYHPDQDPAWIEAQRNNSEQLFRHGIPSAAVYDAVSVDGRIGVIFERLQAQSLGEAVSREPERLDEYAEKLAALLRRVHKTKFDKALLTDTLDFLFGHFNVTAIDRFTDRDLSGFAASLNTGETLVHGDFHPMNIMVRNGELILIDTGDAYFRHGILDLVTLYTYLIMQTDTEEKALTLTGMKPDIARRLWDGFLQSFFSPRSEEEKNYIVSTIKRAALIRAAMALASSDDMDESVRSAVIGQILAVTPPDLDAFKGELDAFEAKYIS